MIDKKKVGQIFDENQMEFYKSLNHENIIKFEDQ